MPVERGEEAVLLTPDQVLALVAHADALDLVDVGERDDHELVVAAQVGEPVAEFALAEQAALPANRRAEIILLYLAVQERLQVVTVEAAGKEDMVLDWLGLRASLHIRDGRRGGDRIADRVQVSLVRLLTAANAHAFKD